MCERGSRTGRVSWQCSQMQTRNVRRTQIVPNSSVRRVAEEPCGNSVKLMVLLYRSLHLTNNEAGLDAYFSAHSLSRGRMNYQIRTLYFPFVNRPDRLLISLFGNLLGNLPNIAFGYQSG